MRKYQTESNDPIAAKAATSNQSSVPKYTQLTTISGEGSLIYSVMALIKISRAGLPKKPLISMAHQLAVSMERLSMLLYIAQETADQIRYRPSK